MMKRLIGSLLALALIVSSATAQEFRSLAAGCLAMSVNYKPTPGPTPTPGPVSDICDNCGGDGILGDGTTKITCPICDGTGKKKKVSLVALPEGVLPSVPNIGPGGRKPTTKTATRSGSYQTQCTSEGCTQVRVEDGEGSEDCADCASGGNGGGGFRLFRGRGNR